MKKGMPMRARLAGILGILLATNACGPDSTLLIVEMSSRLTNVHSLRLWLQLDDRLVMPEEQIATTQDTKNFGLLLPEAAAGKLTLSAEGLDEEACVVARGGTDTTLAGRPRVRLTLEMKMQPARLCPEKN